MNLKPLDHDLREFSEMEIPILFFYTIHGTECGMCKEMLLRIKYFLGIFARASQLKKSFPKRRFCCKNWEKRVNYKKWLEMH